ncbi:hypothetical protein FB567DRAFT_596869 [Paraphoma chrysanthemicola]|uniref:F-box domain-containing protein n=1 Tax=Paraphoma chrysanthemicola TaxID=798071 RepID=A0A8K0QXR1_9PLEO|nr:hypothetical protein FB567DRAFT_596869 [Paraphoma chrysanthemicola]
MAPHLLSLPLELRQIIYAYLHKIINTTWPCRTTATSTSIEVHNAPLVSVLLVCSQMHDEYADADCFSALSATIFANLLDEFEENFHRLYIDDHVRTSLTHVQHLSIMSKTPAPWGLEVPIWLELKPIIDALTSKMPKMVSLKVVLRSPDAGMESHMSIKQESCVQGYRARSQALFLSNPPTSFASLSLTTRGEGYQIGYSGYYLDQDTFESGGGNIHDIDGVATKDYYDIYHCTAPVGCYTYGSPTRSKCPPTQQAIIGTWPLHEYPEEALANMSEKWGEDASKEVVTWPHLIFDWKERTGDELKK